MNQTSSLQQKQLKQGQLNFWLTNRIPRVFLTHAMGWLSKIRQPWFVRSSLWAWQKLSDLDLSEAEKSSFDSIHDCFVRRLKPGARPFESTPEVACSPCDALVGARGIVKNNSLLQAKGMVYSLSDLMQSEQDARRCEGYTYVTLRLTASMYHHFHAPHDIQIQQIRYIHGDVWNVNPPTLDRVNSLFARNERAVIRATLRPTGQTLWLVPVAAVLVASMRFTFTDLHLHLNYRGPTEVASQALLSKGEELGWFEHGSTIICLMPPGWDFIGPEPGGRINAGQPMFRQQT